MLDFLAAAFAGAGDAGYRKLLALIVEGSHGNAAVIGHAGGVSALYAALLNGCAGHALGSGYYEQGFHSTGANP